ncbi:hypothetical protein VTJ04DRAFT_6295 [Mycothermus thermophilus]|uniref:uncharacterized protein n=1 Tax=Humicola insolens TaxID=85995 RepID=UPI0037432970
MESPSPHPKRTNVAAVDLSAALFQTHPRTLPSASLTCGVRPVARVRSYPFSAMSAMQEGCKRLAMPLGKNHLDLSRPSSLSCVHSVHSANLNTTSP